MDNKTNLPVQEEKRKKVLELYPIDYPFETIVSRIENEKLILNPDFQRKYKWDKEGNEERTSKFIESCLMRIPLPACYLAETEEGKQEVIDGVQRMTTIQRFFKNEFALEKLTVFSELNGKKFSELGNYRTELETTTIRCIVLRKENARKLVNEIFARLNKGAVELSAQEIRNAIYPGNFNRLLSRLAENPAIKNFKINKNKQEDINEGHQNLEGQELVLRFLAMRGSLTDYGNKLHTYLDDYMKKNQDIGDSEIIKLEKIFGETLEKCLFVFGECFGAAIKTNRKGASKISKRLQPKQGILYYDLQMWSMQNCSFDFIRDYKEQILDTYKSFCQNSFLGVGSLQMKNAINKRRRLWQEALDKIENLAKND